ncbi:hypothetical protein [Stenotrophomonas sp. NLF4-10]|uniref:hypothetical protein n=1 Tax=Stenotrophomonas sp. NLF4-10 TaxID=2918754 RepID=UPI001EFA3101|nr:hypothetical protein [Stenotrophomonas sp. NLF4-10]MCG8277534.1 hypothetical protein [Stenotrophomonas sp. NLF4-10]
MTDTIETMMGSVAAIAPGRWFAMIGLCPDPCPPIWVPPKEKPLTSQGFRMIWRREEDGFTPVFTDTYEKADRGLRSVHVEAKEVQRRVQARCY